MKRLASVLAVLAVLGGGVFVWHRSRGPGLGPAPTAADVQRLGEERVTLRDDLDRLLAANNVLDFAKAPPGNVLVGVPTNFTKALVSQMIIGAFSEVRLHLTNVQAHHEGDVRAQVLFSKHTLGHFLLDVDIKDIRAVLKPSHPELTFGGDKIHIKLPVTVASGRGSGNIRFQWAGQGIAGAVCGDSDVSADVSSDVAPDTYTVEGDFLLSSQGETVVAKPRFGEVELKIRLRPTDEAWATFAAAVENVKDDKNGACGMAIKKLDLQAVAQKIMDRGFGVKLPAKLLREIALPATVEQSVSFNGRTVSLDAHPLGLHVSEYMLWYGVTLGAQGASSAPASASPSPP